ncbi:MAG: hypothetical protein ACRD5H_14470, partial [Nitrososphaerales archaeon]
MAVAHDAVSESHTGAVGSISQASFNWSHVGAASGIDGVLVFVIGLVTADDDSTAVDYGGIALAKVTGGFAVDTATEPMSCQTWFHGGLDIPQGTQTVTVSRNNNVNELYAVAITQTASVAGQICAVHEAGIVLLQGDGTLAEQSVTDGSPGTNSVRYAAAASGLAAFPPTGASSTALHNFDTGNQTAAVVRETTAGQGARNVGFASGTSDDRAVVHLAIKEVTPPVTLDQAGFRGRNDDGSETTATWKAAENTNWSQAVDENLRVRLILDETTGGDPAIADYRLQYNLNSA